MAPTRKVRKVENHVAEESDENSENDMENGEMETIQVEFDVKMPEPSDFHGIKNLLHQLFLKAHINTSELADLLIQQRKITGVVKQASDEGDEMEVDEPDDLEVNFGVFSVVNLTEKSKMNCMQQIRTYLLSHCKKSSSDEVFQAFQRILEDDKKHVGLIISERMVNIPAQIAVPLYTGLSYDMSKATSKGEAFNFEYFILISKIVAFKEGKKEKENLVYTNAEEEIISEVASMTFDFSVSAELDAGLGGDWSEDDKTGQRKRRVLLIPATEYNAMCSKMSSELGT